MTQGPALRADAQRFEQACDWFVRLREEPDSRELVAAWLEWYRSDAANPAAFEEVRELWQATGTLGRVDFGAGTSPPAAPPMPAVAGREAARRPYRQRSWKRRFAAAATVAALTVGAAWLLNGRIEAPQAPMTSFTTAPSEHRSFSLADGSRIDLAGDSSLTATLRKGGRTVELLRGEAYFRVAHDKSRPFIVHTASLHVRAVGTSFDVRTSGDRVVVAVEEGMVVVEHRQEPASAVDSMLALFRPESVKPPGAPLHPVNLRGGQEVSVGVPTQEMQLMPIEPAAVASWREGRLRFAREPLRSVISSIRAATGRDIEMSDPQLGELRFTGTVFSSRVDAWVEGLPAIFPVRVRQDGAQLLIVPRE